MINFELFMAQYRKYILLNIGNIGNLNIAFKNN